jgi:hypothetical protein
MGGGYIDGEKKKGKENLKDKGEKTKRKLNLKE